MVGSSRVVQYQIFEIKKQPSFSTENYFKTDVPGVMLTPGVLIPLLIFNFFTFSHEALEGSLNVKSRHFV